MNEPLDELYLSWLYEIIADRDAASPSKTYWKLAQHMYTTEFKWLIPNDDNRVEDGRDLRLTFIEDLGLDDIDPVWLDLGCSMLEMLIGVSKRLAFLAEEGEVYDWFWHLIDNLKICFNDRKYDERLVEEALDRVIWRRYSRNGTGGLFPLRRARKDQRDEEIWHQLHAYLEEWERP